MKNKRKNNKFKYLFTFILRSFLISILCIMSLSLVFFLVYFGDILLLSKSGNKHPLFGAYVIVSPSMLPTIEINDAIVIKREKDDKYRIGDIITFSSSDEKYLGKTVTHRIVEKENYSENKSLYTTKGDNNNVVDPALVRTEDIYGKVLFKVPSVGYLREFVSTPTNFFLSLLLPAFIFIVYDISRIFILFSKRKTN